MLKSIRSTIVLPIIAFYLYMTGSAPFLGQWDSYDYLKQIVSHQLSALGFGRPAFLGYNILLWEFAKRIFRLDPLHVEVVTMLGIVLLGVVGVLLFRRLAQQFLSPSASRMAVLAFAISPMYAVYSGFIMTEVPMLVALIASAVILWKQSERHPVLSDIAGGLLFGVAIGIREQALTLGPACLWILCSRREVRKSRAIAILWFGCAAAFAIFGPILSFYFLDPAGFIEHMRVWLRAIPMGHIQFWNNVQASLLWILAICPASWLALATGGILAFGIDGRSRSYEESAPRISVPHPMLGFFCSVVLPIVVLWRDADVQIHPRYALIAFPGLIIFCAHAYERWMRSRKGIVLWAVVHVLVFGIAMAAMHPYFQDQADKMRSARSIKDAVSGEALLIGGSYSPILDYYRGIGVRPKWQILWSGWDWNAESADDSVRKAWADRIPVYLVDDPLGWRYFETEHLHFHYLLKDQKKERLLPNFYRVFPD